LADGAAGGIRVELPPADRSLRSQRSCRHRQPSRPDRMKDRIPPEDPAAIIPSFSPWPRAFPTGKPHRKHEAPRDSALAVPVYRPRPSPWREAIHRGIAIGRVFAYA
jgi:hypothetical protein